MRLLLLGILVLCQAKMTFAQDSNTFQELEAPVFLEQILAENNHVLVDVRSSDDFRKSRIEGAINAPNSEVMNSILDTIDQDQPILIYCLYGKRSKMAAQKILEKYQLKVYGLSGGLNAWKEMEYNLDKKRVRERK